MQQTLKQDTQSINLPPISLGKPNTLAQRAKALGLEIGNTQVEAQQGPLEASKHGGLLGLKNAWDLLGVNGLIQKVGIIKQGIPAGVLLFTQTISPAVSSGTIMQTGELLKNDPLLPELNDYGVFHPCALNRTIGNEALDFKVLDYEYEPAFDLATLVYSDQKKDIGVDFEFRVLSEEEQTRVNIKKRKKGLIIILAT